MELIGAFVAGLGVGAGIAWALHAIIAGHLRAELGAAQEAETARCGELASAREDGETWRGRLQAEQLARTRFETEARRTPELVQELQFVRADLGRAVAEQAGLRTAAERVPGLEGRVRALGEEVAGLREANAQLQVRLDEQAQAHAEQIAVVTQLRGEIDKDLKALMADAMQANNSTFLQYANEIFEKHQSRASTDLKTLVVPLREKLQSFTEHVQDLEKARVHAHGALSSEIKGVVAAQNAVRAETAKLVNALRAAPKTRGRWGEHTLRNVLELSGLSDHCDFVTEPTFAANGTVSRPDVVIRLPGGRRIVVDAKTSLSAYLDAVEATDEAERDRLLTLHARQLREHMKQLASKAYWDLLAPAPDFVLMFVPGDNFYAAALERDGALFEDAAAQRVIIVTPATLIALAKAVAFGWRQEKVAENAQRVHELGRELYRRLAKMTEHVEKCGNALGRSVQVYNQLVGSLEHSVMPQARRFNELQVEGTATEIPRLEQIELQTRALRSDDKALDEATA
jgi:DNA recombination protein RmuC